MPGAYCGMHTAHIFILLCVPWLLYSEGAGESVSKGNAPKSDLQPCPTSRDLNGQGGRLCNPRPEQGWNSLGSSGSSAPGGWSGGGWSGGGSSSSPAQGSWPAIGNGVNRPQGSWTPAGNGGGWSGGSANAHPGGAGGNWNGGSANARPGAAVGSWNGGSENVRPGGAGGSLNGVSGSSGNQNQPVGWRPQGGSSVHRPPGRPGTPGIPGRPSQSIPGPRPHPPTRRPHHFKQPNYCRFRAVAGPCRAFMKRWHYNYQTRQCEKFVYGGCLGNRNNFPSCSLCLLRCTGNPRTHHGKRCGRRYGPFIHIGIRE
ncbi:uncharacterized protein LOC144175221 isoform X2 [Haemaphysalis longicornis]